MDVRRQPVVAVAASVLAVVLFAAGCGSTSDQPSLASLEADSGAAEATGDGTADGSAQIEVLDGDEITRPAGTAETDADATDSGQADGPSRYSVVAQATVPAVIARSGPDEGSEAVAEFANPTTSGAPLVFRAVPGGASSTDWIEVQLPVQPNGTTGWVPRDAVSLSDNPYRVEIDRAGYSLKVFHLNDLWVETAIAVGNGETPTPVGEFYLLELLQPSDPTGAYGPYAFGLSGFSEVLTSFGGADEAIIGLHGTNDPSSLGTDVSHGCIRLENELIEQFAAVLPLGTPVVIT